MKKTIILLLISQFFATPSRAASNEYPVELSNSDIETIRQSATEFAKIIAANGEVHQVSPSQMISSLTVKNMAEFNRRVNVWANSHGKNLAELEAGLKTEEAGKYAEAIKRVADSSALRGFLPILLWPTGVFLTMGILMQQNPIQPLMVFQGFWAILPLSSMSSMLNNGANQKKAEISEIRRATLQEMVTKVFFTRLTELDINYDRRNPIAWLARKMEGNPLPAWDKLTRGEKVKWVQDYVAFLKEVATVSYTHPELAEEIKSLANEMDAKVPGKWWLNWRQKTYRELARHLTESMMKLAAIEERYGFLRNPELLDTIHLGQRGIFDFPEVFSAETKRFFMETKLPLPRSLEAFLPKIQALGGNVELNYSNQLLGQGRGQTSVAMTITIPGSAEPPAVFDFQVDYPINEKTNSAALIHQTALAGMNLNFSLAANTAAEAADIAGRIQAEHERRFPEEHCPSALTKLDKVVSAVAEGAQ